jgi:hypothetical protein
MSDDIKDLFDEALGESLKQEAIRRVDENAQEEWKAAALAAVYKVAQSHPMITTDTVWQAIPEEVETHEGRAMGAIMVKAAKEGWITKTNQVSESARPACHRRPLALWKSNFWKCEGEQ